MPHGRRRLVLVLAMSVAFAACATRFDPRDLRNYDAAADSMGVADAVADAAADSQPVADSSDIVDAVVMMDSPVADAGVDAAVMTDSPVADAGVDAVVTTDSQAADANVDAVAMTDSQAADAGVDAVVMIDSPVADAGVDAVIMIDSPVVDVGCASCPAGTTCCGGSCFDLQTDPANCSVCGATCPGASHAVPVCTLGTCGTQCAAGYEDCDGLAFNGCETAIATSVANCGLCGNACVLPAATALCSSGMCAIDVCAHGYFDCNAIAADGCETHCGGGPSCCP